MLSASVPLKQYTNITEIFHDCATLVMLSTIFFEMRMREEGSEIGDGDREREKGLKDGDRGTTEIIKLNVFLCSLS